MRQKFVQLATKKKTTNLKEYFVGSKNEHFFILLKRKCYLSLEGVDA